MRHPPLFVVAGLLLLAPAAIRAEHPLAAPKVTSLTNPDVRLRSESSVRYGSFGTLQD